MRSSGVLPQVEPLCVFRKGFGYGGQVSECTVDLLNAGAATGPGARRGGAGRVDLQGWSRGVRAVRM